ncbi:MAG: hypothetical protein IIA59_06005 [Candidatus Marinimicrobia bacterium]|nr:hypothetical protein [Candidatus Neomarinimicrobiota bacterium]
MNETNFETKTKYLETDELLKQLHGQEMFEIFTAHEPDKKIAYPKPMPLSVALLDFAFLESQNAGKRGIWFSANSMKNGKRKTVMISRFNAVSIEKDFVGSRAEIDQQKADYLPMIRGLQLIPTVTIETKHGYQFHWLLIKDTITDSDQCEALMRAMQVKLGCDPLAIGSERLWRLPGFYHWKDADDPFMCKIVDVDYSKRYTYDELVHKFGGKKKVAAIRKKRAQKKFSGKPIHLADFKGNGDIDDIGRGCHVFADLQSKKDPGHWDRLALLLTLMHLGEEGLERFRAITKNWNDYDEAVTESVIADVIQKGYHAPTCDKLIEKGVCPGKRTNIRGYRKPLDLYHHPVNLLPVPFKNRRIVSDTSVALRPDHTSISEMIFKVSESHGQVVTPKHRKTILSIAKSLSLRLTGNEPIVIPAIPGVGKTILIVIYLKFMVDHYPGFGAVVVVERHDTIDLIANMLKRKLHFVTSGLDFYMARAYGMKGYSADYCQKGYPRYKPSQCKTCDVSFMDCRVKYNFIKQKDYPIVIISQSRLFQMSDKDDLLKILTEWKSGGVTYKRELLLIDERPKLVENVATNSIMLDTLVVDTKQYVPECVAEVETAVKKIRDSYSLGGEYEYVAPKDKDFTWSKPFLETWADNYLGDYPDYPGYVSSIIKEGGLYYKQDKTVTTIHYSNIFWKDYSTYIFDGTASVDPEYRPKLFRMLELPALRKYTNLTLNICMDASLSKTFYEKHPEFIGQFSEDIKDIAKGAPTYVVCYKSKEEEYQEYLSDTSNISIEHFGNTRGANHLAKTTNIVCTGILNKGEAYYLSKSMAINEIPADFKVVTTDRVRRFKDEHAESIKVYEMVTELVQEIFRTRLRNHSSTAQVNVYLCTRDLNLVNALQTYFTGCTVTPGWAPEALYSDRHLFREFVTNHQDEYKAKTKLVKAFLGEGNSLNTSDIIEVLGVDRSNAARYLR